MTSYEGKRVERHGRVEPPVVLRDGKELDPRPSQKLWNHSPDGFEWGYGGSGPAQLALALLFDVCHQAELSVKLHQDFKWEFVAKWDREWSIGSVEISDWIKKRVAGRPDDIWCEQHALMHSGFCPECSRLRPQIGD